MMVRTLTPDVPIDDEVPDFYKEFRSLLTFWRDSEDRVIALVTAAYCENWVQEILESRMPGLDKKLTGRMFETGRPLGTADARYDLARALNLIKEPTYEDLKRLATIRNRFAHILAVDSFDHPKVAQHVDNLRTAEIERLAQGTTDHDQKKDRRGAFVDNAMSLCIKMHNAVNEVRRKAD
ncbi:hypothetical protein [Qipengyuania sp. SM2507]